MPARFRERGIGTNYLCASRPLPLEGEVGPKGRVGVTEHPVLSISERGNPNG